MQIMVTLIRIRDHDETYRETVHVVHKFTCLDCQNFDEGKYEPFEEYLVERRGRDETNRI